MFVAGLLATNISQVFDNCLPSFKVVSLILEKTGGLVFPPSTQVHIEAIAVESRVKNYFTTHPSLTEALL